MAVRADQDWLDDTANSPVSSVRMFTSESYHRSFWDLAEHGIVLLDADKNIIEANPYFVQLVGMSAADLEGKNISEIVTTRHWRTDNVNLNALIKGSYYSYTNEEEIIHIGIKSTDLVHVRIIVTRVPSTLTDEFQHFIVQVYKIEKAIQIDGQPFVNQANQSYSNIIKNLLMQPWFVQTALWVLLVLIVALTLSGNLMPVIEKFLN
jgi:PAS domain S-box-containing protein